MSKITLFLAALALVATAPSAFGQTPPVAFPDATVHLPDGSTRVATVVISKGRIRSIGATGSLPSGTRVIQGRGRVITAGLIESLSTLGLVEVDMVTEANDGSFSGSHDDDSVHAAYRVTDSYNWLSVAIPVTRQGGVTGAVVAPRGGLLSGQAAFFPLSGRPDGSVGPVAMVAQLGARVLGGGPSRGLTIERLREVLDDAQVYRRAKARFERNQTREFAAGRLDLEALGPVLAGRVPLILKASRASDLRAALSIAKDYGLKLIIAGGEEAWLLADELAKAKVPVILDPMSNLPRNFDKTRVRPDNAVLLSKAGVQIAISTLGAASGARRLRQLAGNAVARGLPWKDALAAITKVPAKLFGLRGRGELKVGAIADLVVWSGDPLELSSRPELVIIGGELTEPVSHQTRLRDRYRRLPPR